MINDIQNDDSTTMTTTISHGMSGNAVVEDTGNNDCYYDRTKYYVLIEFAVRHLDFQIAELVSVLNMYGITVVSSGHNHNKNNDSNTCNPAVNNDNSKPDITNDDDSNLCTLIPLHNDKRFPSHKYKTYSNMDSTKPSSERRKDEDISTRPFAILCFNYSSPFVPNDAISAHDQMKGTTTDNQKSDDIASIILSRCTLVRSVIELWGIATSVEECAMVTVHRCTQTSSVCNKLFLLQSKPDQSWKMTVHTLGSTYTRQEQDAMRHLFTTKLNLEGTVQMIDPKNEFVVIREIELDPNGGPKLQNNVPQHDSNNNHNGRHVNNNGQYPSIACYFGRALGGCRSVRRMRGNIPKYDLKQRKYLGPTSMDSELSFIMTNFGQVNRGQFVLDPFVGTGSILLSCAARGAYCVGTDIDIRVLRGRSSDENIFSNFRQFHLPPPELIRSDNGIYHRHFRFVQPIYDAIICDPPYGIRAGARKSGSKRENFSEVKPENRHDHIAQTQTYPVSDVLADLVDVASRTLVLKGWLVYVIPSFAMSFDVEVDLPRHPCLELIHVCYQPLSTELGRRFVAMRKIAEYDETKREEYLRNAWKNGPESAEKCANIRAKIIEAAKTKPRYEERAAIRKEKRRLHREEKKLTKKLSNRMDDT